jgi:hypothetical protein
MSRPMQQQPIVLSEAELKELIKQQALACHNQ